MKVGILEAGQPPASLIAAHGTYADMTARLLGPHACVEHFAAMSGRLPERPGHCDAYIVTGSPAGVYDAEPWIAPLLEFLRAARGRARLVGICFGHQALAQALGGRVEPSAKGWGIGLHRYDVRGRAGWMDADTPVTAAAFHQDQVVAAPPGARVTLASDFTPFAGLDYGDAISFQFHPEFGSDFCTALLDAGRDRYGPGTDPAIASYAAPQDGARVAGWIRSFLALPSR